MQGGPYYHQFLIPLGMQMPLLMLIPPMRNVQDKEAMDIPGPSMAAVAWQRPASASNPDYILPLKRDTEIDQRGRDHSGQRNK
uniref:Uncharacterized protein n=1 Tax=Romanomermis culicivorax TaxID=13658 RepID=A0A915KI98_ROMCU